jgi:hypothetical protein
MSIDVSVFRLVSGENERPSLYYNLYVSNLEDMWLQYVVEYWHRATFDGVHVTPGRFRDVQRTVSPQHGVFVATHGFALLPHETAVITLRVATEPQPVDVDIAGHVRLRVPRVRPEGQQNVRLVAQATGPVKVMLHAETVTDVELSSSEKGGFRDMKGYAVGHYGSVGSLSNLRTAVGLAVASGRALNEIRPDGSFIIDKESLARVNRLAEALPAQVRKGATQDLADEDRAEALVELLAELRGDGDTLREVNRILRAAGVDVEVAALKRRDSGEKT